MIKLGVLTILVVLLCGSYAMYTASSPVIQLTAK